MAIEGFYDEINQIIYLHVHSLLDTNCLLEYYNDFLKKCDTKYQTDDFLTVYDEVKCAYAKAFMFLSYISHIIILSHPGSTFDLNYIQYFKAVDNLR